MKKSSRERRQYIRMGKRNYREDLVLRHRFAKENGVNLDDVVILGIGINNVFHARPYTPYNVIL